MSQEKDRKFSDIGVASIEMLEKKLLQTILMMSTRIGKQYRLFCHWLCKDHKRQLLIYIGQEIVYMSYPCVPETF
ncbi:hypothetical protein AusDCA_2746 [Desulfitobacterium sp. AusDCA]